MDRTVRFGEKEARESRVVSAANLPLPTRNLRAHSCFVTEGQAEHRAGIDTIRLSVGFLSRLAGQQPLTFAQEVLGLAEAKDSDKDRVRPTRFDCFEFNAHCQTRGGGSRVFGGGKRFACLSKRNPFLEHFRVVGSITFLGMEK